MAFAVIGVIPNSDYSSSSKGNCGNGGNNCGEELE